MNDRLGPLMLDLAGTELSPLEADQLRQALVGGVILFTRNFSSPQQLASLVQSIRQVRPDLLIAADTEGGRVQRFRPGFIQLPAVAEYGRYYAKDPAAAVQLAFAGGWLLAAELRAMDIDLAFAPVLDLDAGVSGVIGDRAFAEDEHAVAALACAHAQGLRAAGMAATGKHFPGHGFVVPDSHVELPVDERDAERISQKDGLPYRALIADGLESVMVAHVLYPQVDSQPASISSYWIQRCLREEFGFTGAVFSDDLSMGGLAQYGDVHARFNAALQAGCDMIPVCNRPEDVRLLLAEPAVDWSADISQRLQALRGKQRAEGLSELRSSMAYQDYFSMLHQFMAVEVLD